MDGGEGVQVAMKTRVVRRRPENERWSKEKLAAVSCFPWTSSEKIADAAMPSRPRRYITKGEVERLGPTEGCRGCSGEAVTHSAPCKVRFERFWEEEQRQKDLLRPVTPSVLGDNSSTPG